MEEVELVLVMEELEETFWKRTVVLDLDFRIIGLRFVQFMRSVGCGLEEIKIIVIQLSNKN